MKIILYLCSCNEITTATIGGGSEDLRNLSLHSPCTMVVNENNKGGKDHPMKLVHLII